MSKKKARHWLVGGIVLMVAISTIAFLQLDNNLVYFYTPQEAYAKAADLREQTIKIGGMIKPGTVIWKPETLSLTFTMGDMEGHEIIVRHQGTPPDMFKEGQGVVVEGRLNEDGREMVSRQLMVKHSEEYKKPGDHATMDKALLEKSLFKD